MFVCLFSLPFTIDLAVMFVRTVSVLPAAVQTLTCGAIKAGPALHDPAPRATVASPRVAEMAGLAAVSVGRAFSSLVVL